MAETSGSAKSVGDGLVEKGPVPHQSVWEMVFTMHDAGTEFYLIDSVNVNMMFTVLLVLLQLR